MADGGKGVTSLPAYPRKGVAKELGHPRNSLRKHGFTSMAE
jgi:hypothetical protein